MRAAIATITSWTPGAVGEALHGAPLLWRTQFSKCSAVRWTLGGVAQSRLERPNRESK